MGDTAHPAAARSGETRDDSADVIAVGAGPAGATRARHSACAGRDVLVRERSTFPHEKSTPPHEKVRGDGLTLMSVKHLHNPGVDFSGSEWIRNRGPRIVGGGDRLGFTQPELGEFPIHGFVRVRRGCEETVARHVQATRARIRQGTNLRAPTGGVRSDRIVGVRAEGQEQPRAHPQILRSHGGYFTLRRRFVTVVGQPEFMRLVARCGLRYGLRKRTLMRFELKLLANLTDPHEGDAMDRVINGLSRLAPAA